METTYTTKQKERILKWRQNNLDTYRDYQRKYAFEHYDDIKEKKKQYYEENKEKKMAVNIGRFVSALHDANRAPESPKLIAKFPVINAIRRAMIGSSAPRADDAVDPSTAEGTDAAESQLDMPEISAEIQDMLVQMFRSLGQYDCNLG